MNDALDPTREPAPAHRRFVGITAIVAAAAMILASVAAAAAAAMPTYWFAGSALMFERPQMRAETVAVATNDAGLTHFLLASGATIAYDDVAHTVVVTTANHRLIRFSIGDAQFTVDGATHVGAFAPYVNGRSVYVPFVDLSRAMAIEPVENAGVTVLTPRLGAMTPAIAGRTGGPETSAVPTIPPEPALADRPIEVTGFKTDESTGSATIHVALSGSTAYEPHRLSDGRWYVDMKPATLAIASQNVPLGLPQIQSMRIKSFLGPTDAQPTVRIALTLPGADSVTLGSDRLGLAITVTDPAAAAASISGPSPPPIQAAAARSRIIVIDPGHGGSDSGAMHLGLVEKTLTLDIAMRLRAILVARGWSVLLTRERDVDVYQPNDEARDELQARDDVANAANAQLFVSIHCNAYLTGGPHGTTTYFYKPESRAFAQSVHDRLAATLPTADDGIVRANYYVIHHASMPAILIESAFVSNARDASLLRTPAFLQQLATGIADGVDDYSAHVSSRLSMADARSQ